MQNTKTIGVIGGGPGGLTLARILLNRGIASTVFELDAHPLERPQGGSLDLHGESGLLALQHAGLLAEFRRLARYEDQGDRFFDCSGKLLFEHAGQPDGDRPEIDRTQLRQLLLDSLPPDVVRWGCKVSAIEPLTDGRLRVLGDGGSLGQFDLVVGADGAWSKVRPLVSSERPRYSGVTFIELGIDDVDRRHPEIAALVPNGKLSVIGKAQGLIAQRNSNGHIRIYLMFRVPADWIEKGGVDLSTPAAAKASLKAQLVGWAPTLLALIDAANDMIVPRPIVALPVGHRWPHRPGVTLLGDAAHVMSPFGGEGVNMAMLDATELALALAEDADWSRAVSRYEARMFERAAGPARQAEQGLSFVSESAVDRVIAHVRSVMAGGHPQAD